MDVEEKALTARFRAASPVGSQATDSDAEKILPKMKVVKGLAHSPKQDSDIRADAVPSSGEPAKKR